MAILIYPVYIIQTLCVFFFSLSNSLLYFANVFSFLFQIFENSETLWTSIYIYRIYIDFPRNRGNAWIFACRFASMATLDTCPETRRWAARLPCETHIKAVDKRKGALIVRRSSIHEVAGYGYTYVLRCAYTDPVCTRFPHTYTRDAITHVCTCGVRVLSPTRSKASLAMRGHGTRTHTRAHEWNGFGVGRIALTFLKSPLVCRDKTKARWRHWSQRHDRRERLRFDSLFAKRILKQDLIVD